MNDLFSRRRKPPIPPSSQPPVDQGDEDPRYLMELAQVALRRGQFAEAVSLGRRILATTPDHLPAKQMLSFASAQIGDNATGIQYLSEILEAQPDNVDALMGISQLLRNEGRLEEALGHAEHAAEISGGQGSVLHNYGRILLGMRRHQEALDSFNQVLALNPRFAPALIDRGAVLQEMGRASEAAEDLRAAIEINPEAVPAYMRLGNLYLSNGNAEFAISCFRRAFELDPSSPQTRVQLARALVEEGNFEAAESTLRETIAATPDFAEGYAFLGRVLQQVGRFDEARDVLERALRIQPERTATFYTFINGRKTTEADRPLVERMCELGESGRLSAEEERPLRYALGKAFEDLGDYEAAFAQYKRANQVAQSRLHGAGRVFDRSRLRARTDAAIATFTAELFNRRHSDGDSSDLPLFIVGMARSGTTLLEQIVSSHSQVGAAGEQGYWLVRMFTAPPAEVAVAQAADLRGLGGEYVRLLEHKAPNARFVTDKMPQNFAVLGPIHLCLPNAKVIHCRRSPIDTCLSIYTTSFNAGPDFAHDQEDLVFAYREYQRLVAHWREVLPRESFLEIDYEELVADRETVTRRILVFLGLSWDDAVLHHEWNAHAISTPSLWQARQPVYRSSVERWRRFEPWLGGLRELIELEEA